MTSHNGHKPSAKGTRDSDESSPSLATLSSLSQLPVPTDPNYVYPLSSFPPTEAFEVFLKYPSLIIPVRQTASLRKQLKHILLHRPKLKNVYDVLDTDEIPTTSGSDDSSQARSSYRKLVLVDRPDVYKDPEIKSLIKSGECCKGSHTIKFGYSDWSVDELLRKLVPLDDKELPSSFETIGTLAHVNLRADQLPFKFIIGKVLLDKNSPRIKTVVNKAGAIETEYRTFGMEIIAGYSDEGWSRVTAKEEGCTFELDFREVYWNSRLCGEHRRLVRLIQDDAKKKYPETTPTVIADLMAGIGPFAVPLTCKRVVSGDKQDVVIKVYANDLNPSSFKYLERNAQKNKCTYLECYNMDARAFCHQLQDQGIEFHHVLMNLPGTAPEFLDCFRGFIGSFLPRIHVHCFGPKSESDDTKESLILRCSNALGCTINVKDHQVSVHMVRDVSPKKNMYCISFTLPKEARDIPRISTSKSPLTATDEDPEPKRAKLSN